MPKLSVWWRSLPTSATGGRCHAGFTELRIFLGAPGICFGQLPEREAHFVGLAESQIFVERASEIAGVQGDGAQALAAAPRDRRDHQLPGEPLAAELGFGVDILD